MLKNKNLALQKMFIFSFGCTLGLEDKPYLLLDLAKAERCSSRVCSGNSIEDSTSEMEDANSYIHSESGSSASAWAFTKWEAFSQSFLWSTLPHIYTHWTKEKKLAWQSGNESTDVSSNLCSVYFDDFPSQVAEPVSSLLA